MVASKSIYNSACRQDRQIIETAMYIFVQDSPIQWDWWNCEIDQISNQKSEIEDGVLQNDDTFISTRRVAAIWDRHFSGFIKFLGVNLVNVTSGT